uniref:Uncharacterized protein n=1 Tax=Ananas comosus var. bracteatus TaxID=296719 RepID=A0A6V7PYD3_ANACO|nr:unnamed protein product [Ananas comosus var. bracteatus]
MSNVTRRRRRRTTRSTRIAAALLLPAPAKAAEEDESGDSDCERTRPHLSKLHQPPPGSVVGGEQVQSGHYDINAKALSSTPEWHSWALPNQVCKRVSAQLNQALTGYNQSNWV